MVMMMMMIIDNWGALVRLFSVAVAVAVIVGGIFQIIMAHFVLLYLCAQTFSFVADSICNRYLEVNLSIFINIRLNIESTNHK